MFGYPFPTSPPPSTPPSTDVYVSTELGARWRMKRAVFLTVLVKRAAGEDVRYSTLGATPVEYVPEGAAFYRPTDWCPSEIQTALDALRQGGLPPLRYAP